jgi:RES domain-containing protein
VEVYRLTRERYAHDLSGKGSAMKGARWNSIGVELIYTATNRSLAMAEVAVHFTWATLPSDYCMVTIHVPDSIAFKHLNEKDLPRDWEKFPHSEKTQIFGDQFVMDNEFCAFKVPSVVTKGDFNLLINPKHADFSQIKIVSVEPFPFDSRLLK